MSPIERSITRVLADTAFTLSSCDDAPARLRRVLELIRESVPCSGAALRVRGAQAPAADVTVGGDAAGLARRAATLLARLDEGPLPTEGFIDNGAAGSEMAVPLVSRDADVLGLILLRRAEDRPYADEELQRLSVAGSLVSSYLAWLEMRTEHATLIERERRARERAEVASRAKDTFLANLSHELRTPLNAIAGWASLLRKGGLTEATQQRAFEVIDRSAKAEAQLIDDVLDVSRIVSGKLRMNMTRVDVGSTLAAVVEAVLPTAEVKGLTVTVQAEAGLTVVADAARLHQVVWNLLSNAVKFTPKGGCIDVFARRAGAAVELAVRDTGIGIRPGFLPHLFERFSQADDSPRRENPGLGLGLAIVNHIIEAHGGTVSAESGGENLGSTFCVQLPAADPPDASTEVTGEPSEPRAAEEEGLTGGRILVVDDDDYAREMVEYALSARKLLVRTAASGREASALLASADFDLLLVDIAMPEEDGHTFLRRIRSEGCTVPAIALTAYGRAYDRQAAEQSGFSRHLTKPATADELFDAIRQALGTT